MHYIYPRQYRGIEYFSAYKLVFCGLTLGTKISHCPLMLNRAVSVHSDGAQPLRLFLFKYNLLDCPSPVHSIHSLQYFPAFHRFNGPDCQLRFPVEQRDRTGRTESGCVGFPKTQNVLHGRELPSLRIALRNAIDLINMAFYYSIPELWSADLIGTKEWKRGRKRKGNILGVMLLNPETFRLFNQTAKL